jgi:hypothetical protein
VNAVIFHANERGSLEDRVGGDGDRVTKTLRAIDQLQEIATLNGQLFVEFCEKPDASPLFVSNEPAIVQTLVALREKLGFLRKKLRVCRVQVDHQFLTLSPYSPFVCTPGYSSSVSTTSISELVSSQSHDFRDSSVALGGP